MEKKKLLFVCIENSNRSQMSQAFATIYGKIFNSKRKVFASIEDMPTSVVLFVGMRGNITTGKNGKKESQKSIWSGIGSYFAEMLV